MHISYKPLWHTLLERDMRKEDLRLAAGMTTNMIANMSKELRDVSCVFTEPCLLPSAGGIILACRAAGNEVSEQMIENLRTAQHMRV